MVEQLNKLQIRAELLTIISKFQTLTDVSRIDEFLELIEGQEDKKTVLDTLIKEVIKTNEQKAYIICYLLLRLCEKVPLENALWNVLKSPIVNDYNKTIVLNMLKDMGNRVDYDELGQYFESPDDVIDADTKELLHSAIMNPEAQIDFLDFLNALPYEDKITLVQSLGDDYSEDALANILIPVFLHDPTAKIAQIALDVLGTTKSQLALHALEESLEFADEDILPNIKRNISTLKLSGVRVDNSIDFYKQVLSESKPYESYTSYPDGHGNQALIFSRERADESIQILAVVINDKWGIVDCFGFNKITKREFEQIVDRFYGEEDHVYINQTVLKSLITDAENIIRRNGEIMSYEYICWRNLFADIPLEPVPIEFILEDKFEKTPLSKDDFDKICLSEIAQKWFMDTDFSDEFAEFIEKLNKRFLNNDFNVDFDEEIEKNLDKIYPLKDKKRWAKRILKSAYLKYLAHEKVVAQRLYSLYFDEDSMKELYKNIVRKSVYEYYVLQKFKIKDKEQTTNIFARNKEEYSGEFTIDKIEKIIEMIESKWVENV